MSLPGTARAPTATLEMETWTLLCPQWRGKGTLCGRPRPSCSVSTLLCLHHQDLTQERLLEVLFGQHARRAGSSVTTTLFY